MEIGLAIRIITILSVCMLFQAVAIVIVLLKDDF